MMRRAKPFLILLAVFTLTHWPQSAQADDAVWEDVSSGTVVLFRHANAPGMGDPGNFKLGDCSTQRNLDNAGREQARKIGERFRERQIKVSAALTSEWCRCRETADLAFPGQSVDAPVFNSFFADRSRSREQTADAIELLEKMQTASGAVVVVTHQVNITALARVFPLSGEGIVVRVQDGTVEVLGRLAPP